MITRDSFSVEEWAGIVSAPAAVGALVVTADPSGPMGLIGEFRAMTDSLKAYVEAHAGEGSLMAAMKEYITTQPSQEEQDQLKQWAEGQQEQMKANKPKSPEELHQRIRDIVGVAIATLQEKGATEEDLTSFRAMMVSVAEAVANASKEGGFLGFGGTLVSDKEESILVQIRQELAG